jgi:hypothetical protein
MLLNPIRLLVILGMLWGNLCVASAMPAASAELNIDGIAWKNYSSGIRSYNLIDVYQCGFYFYGVEKFEKDNLMASIHSLNSAFAIRIIILTSMLPETMPDQWRKTIEEEVTGRALNRFKKGFARLNENDVLAFAYLPGKGTRFFLNGKFLFKDPGSGLMQSLLEQWIGSQPVSEDLKQVLIGD